LRQPVVRGWGMAAIAPLEERPPPAALEGVSVVCLCPGRYYWACLPSVPKFSQEVHYFSSDGFEYLPFANDFGPLNLAVTHAYCTMMEQKLRCPALKDKVLVHWTTTNPAKRANAAFLAGAYLVLVRGWSAALVTEKFKSLTFPAYRDALSIPCSFQCTLEDCWLGCEEAMRCGWHDFEHFDRKRYEHYEKVENGDMNWVIPGLFLAFAGPMAEKGVVCGCPVITPEDLVPIFQSMKVGLIIRLNNKQYDREKFIQAGFRHVDLYFPDGTCPPQEIVRRFLLIAEAETTAMAIHCKAGLGRTGTLIGIYAMKHFGVTPRGFIAWNRICRPGAILGPQQQFLCDLGPELSRQHAALPRPLPRVAEIAATGRKAPPSQPAEPSTSSSLPDAWRATAVDVGQGERLCGAKAKAQNNGPRKARRGLGSAVESQ